jgi:hypothetical protein
MIGDRRPVVKRANVEPIPDLLFLSEFERIVTRREETDHPQRHPTPRAAPRAPRHTDDDPTEATSLGRHLRELVEGYVLHGSSPQRQRTL